MSANFLLTISCFRIKIYSRDSRAGNCGGNLVLVSDAGDALRGRRKNKEQQNKVQEEQRAERTRINVVCRKSKKIKEQE